MLDLEHELRLVIGALHERGIEYALCGGLAMAVHGRPRATIDIDLLIRSADLQHVAEAVNAVGFSVHARPMTFSNGAVEIRRILKIDPADGETLMLDLLLVTPAMERVWQDRQTLEWGGRTLVVVSREGLIALKQFRSDEQDLVDIKHLRELA